MTRYIATTLVLHGLAGIEHNASANRYWCQSGTKNLRRFDTITVCSMSSSGLVDQWCSWSESKNPSIYLASKSIFS